jgi:hypothetical protein
MAERKRADRLTDDIIARKGTARPATAPDRAGEEPTAARGAKTSVALTVRLDAARYRRILAYGAQFIPRRSHQEILVAALDAYLDAHAS